MDYKEQVENLLYDAKDWAGDPHIRKDLYGSAQSITDLLARAEAAEARAEKAEVRLFYAEECVAALSLILKALDGEMKMESTLPIARRQLGKYNERFPHAKLEFHRQDE